MQLASQRGPQLRVPAIETTLDRCLRYRQDLGLPAVIAPGTERIIVHCLDGRIGAVIAPAPMCRSATAQLGDGLVIAHPRSSRMTFLTRPGCHCDIEPLSRTLLLNNIAVDTTWAVLPSPSDEQSGYRRWESPPRSGALPPMLAVLGAILGAKR
ncbi:hypothetical protein [Nocardia salmonicida]|uniref:hypothetical protein n=1 Tax=Nocardia salmonicida TaxID=53431 RepID=UPI000A70A357|nr:hypothetical protein [Nocardia salmonicida]